HRGEAGVRPGPAERVHLGPGRHERGGRIDTERAFTAILADRTLDRRELDAEIAPHERAPGLLRPANVVDAIERDEIEDALRLGASRDRDHTQRERQERDACRHRATLHGAKTRAARARHSAATVAGSRRVRRRSSISTSPSTTVVTTSAARPAYTRCRTRSLPGAKRGS